MYGYVPPPETLVELFAEPEGWRILDNDPFHKLPVRVVRNRNPRSGNYNNNGQGVGTDYSRWLGAEKTTSQNCEASSEFLICDGNEQDVKQ